MDPLKLPIRQYQQQIVDSVRNNPVTVVIGETGSGKTTQISQILEEADFADDGIIGAAVTVARRVAWEKKVELGQEVGYAVRFEDRTSRCTRIKYLTDGTLLRECLDDAELARYSVLVLDEAHERSLNTDILFGLLKELVARRKRPLKLVVTSATLDGEKFSKYFSSCPVFHVPGRAFPVDVVHALEDHTGEYLAAAVDAAVDIHCNQPEGDILVFLTGQAEIDKAVRQLNEAVRQLPAHACGDLLARVFAPAPSGCRRCIVATNIAETSVTVDGVVYVIDSGMVKQKEYNPRTGMDSLGVTPISRVQATQRAGRAGRTRPGRCFRLYTQKFFEREMPDTTAPEIQRTSLVGAVLYLKSLPLSIDVLGFDYLDAPAVRQGAGAGWQQHQQGGGRGRGPGGGGGGGGGGAPAISAAGRQLLQELMQEGLGDHILLLRLYEAWDQAGQSIDWCRDIGVDGRSMRFARDIRQQLERIIGPDGAGLEAGGARRRQHDAQPPAGAGQQQGGGGGEGRPWDGARDVGRGERAGAGGGGRREYGRDGRDGRDSKREREREGGEGLPRGGKRPRRGFSDAATVTSLRMALTIGFANRLARRMPMHNGYRTLGQSSTLAQVCAVEAAWVQAIIPRLENIDVNRLSGGKTGQAAIAAAEARAAGTEAAEQQRSAAVERRNTGDAVAAARARYLARKKAGR
ncbi:hypothetical protein CHLNCDRAFT_136192 [Chlorella variabilis]|uniref:RNA helicase n=1 Tax=Chlorella variabilis TaxID=554065 RepID=E1ZJZ2_CHLVA|nr:hypothetical protein CHLNCDRAFT_136192 [Chlorella variabilis]EFN54077.1 hypothetical protein CHLNCDRAFT_136192 [Chlorella variabilis]|eukprot:XP_005846179.1 hypothetical protein CHLNCDRAFT_136192 [Chlorella variabilis]